MDPNKFGITQEYLRGNELSASHVFSFVLFFNNLRGKYATYAPIVISELQKIIPEPFVIRLYVDSTVPNTYLQQFEDPIQIIRIKSIRYLEFPLLSIIYRYLPLFDEKVKVCVFRDIDNVWTTQDMYFINQWLDSDCDVQLALNPEYTRNEPQTSPETSYLCMLAGLWAIKKKQNFSSIVWQQWFAYIELITASNPSPRFDRFFYGWDELVLSRVFLPLLLKNNYTFYAYIVTIFDIPTINKLFRNIRYITTNSPELKESDVIQRYWDFDSYGYSQYYLCIICNAYFRIIIDPAFVRQKRLTRIDFTRIKNSYNHPILMGLGNHTYGGLENLRWSKLSEIVEDTLKLNTPIPAPSEYVDPLYKNYPINDYGI